MDNARFSIMEAVKNAYLFMGREFSYLLRCSIVPISAQFLVSMVLMVERPEASPMENYLWGLPISALFGWFIFIEVRLLLLGERVGQLPQDKGYLADRMRSMQLCVILWLLFNMGLAGSFTLLFIIASSGQWGHSLFLTTLGMLLMGGIIWGLRFGIVPVLAAVNHPIRPVIRQTWGMMFSIRLIGMMIVALVPVAFIAQILAAGIGISENMTAQKKIILFALNAPIALAIPALLAASATYALKEILGSNSRRNGVLA